MSAAKWLCIYHGNCSDGFAAAYCVRAVLGETVEFYPANYNQDPPNVADRDVIIVDFSYPPAVLEDMGREARSIIILDHHKTALQALGGYSEPPPWQAWYNSPNRSGIHAIFDMERSGAILAFDYFIGMGDTLCWPLVRTSRLHLFLEYIQDHDLWHKRLPDSDEFALALRSYPLDFATWDVLYNGLKNLIAEGRAIKRYYDLRVAELVRDAYSAVICEQRTCVVNAPGFFASDVAGELAKRSGTFGATWSEIVPGRFKYSLRSQGFDVSALASRFGGGGHLMAAGFTVDKLVHSPIEE